MIAKEKIEGLVRPVLEEDDCFLVELDVKPGNRIVVLIDSLSGVSIEYCIRISRLIEHSLDREVEDFELEVSSPGIGQPFKVKEQYHKALGRFVEVMTLEGKVIKGTLIGVQDQGVTVSEEKMVRKEGKKCKKELQITEHQFSFEDVKRIKELVCL